MSFSHPLLTCNLNCNSGSTLQSPTSTPRTSCSNREVPELSMKTTPGKATRCFNILPNLVGVCFAVADTATAPIICSVGHSRFFIFYNVAQLRLFNHSAFHLMITLGNVYFVAHSDTLPGFHVSQLMAYRAQHLRLWELLSECKPSSTAARLPGIGAGTAAAHISRL